jgi:hypothetical protein
MKKSKSSNITLSFTEIAALEWYLKANKKNLTTFASGAAYTASSHGVTIFCTSEKQSINVWCAVLGATEQEEH